MADSPFDGVLVAHAVRLFGDSFSDSIGAGGDNGTFPASVTTAGTGGGGVASGHLSLSTGGSANGAAASIQSNLTAPVLTGASTKFQSAIHIPTGYTIMSVVARSGGVDTLVNQGSFVTSVPVRSNTYNLYDIIFRAPSIAFFQFNGSTLYQMPGATDSPRLASQNLPLRYEISNSGGYTIARWGAFDSSNGYFFEARWTAASIAMKVRDVGVFRVGVTPESLVSAVTTGATSSIGTSAVQLTSSNIPCRFGVKVIADRTNTGTVYVGRSTVTNGVVDATDGFPLLRGEQVGLPIRNANLVWVIGSTAGQKVYWIAA